MKNALINRFEDDVILFNMGDFFSKEIKEKDHTIIFNDDLPSDPYLNYVTKIRVGKNVDKFISDMEKTFVDHKSSPTFYILPYTLPKNLEKTLISKNYDLFGRDAWMFFDINKKAPKANPNIVIRNITKNEISDFKKVFVGVFSKGEEDDPYKGLSTLYGEFLQKRLTSKKKECKAIPYGAFIDDKLVGTIVILHNNVDAYLYALAVLPEFRKLGICTSLIAKCVEKAKNLKLKNLSLITQKSSRNEKIFNNLGFRTKIIGKQYYKVLKN
jgi:ribosomal protein S18 acetylase RimI-like enzyme